MASEDSVRIEMARAAKQKSIGYRNRKNVARNNSPLKHLIARLT